MPHSLKTVWSQGNLKNFTVYKGCESLGVCTNVNLKLENSTKYEEEIQ